MVQIDKLNIKLLTLRIDLKRGDMMAAHEALSLSKQTITIYMRGKGSKIYIAQALIDFFTELINERKKAIA